MKTMRESDAVRMLTSEKEEMVVEKHQLTDDVNRLRKELKDSNRQWKTETEDLKKIIAEKSTLIEDNGAISERLHTEMNSLKSQVTGLLAKYVSLSIYRYIHQVGVVVLTIDRSLGQM